MKKLFKSFLLLCVVLPFTLTVCPEYPTPPTNSPKLFTGIGSFPTSTQQFSITMFITPEAACPAGGEYIFFSMDITPSGGSTQQYLSISYDCNYNQFMFRSSGWFGLFAHPLHIAAFGPFAMFITFDLSVPEMKYEFQFEKTKLSAPRPLAASASSLTFDSNSKFYFCADRNGGSIQACTVSKLVFEHRYYGADNFPYAHLAGDPAVAAFYPLFGESLATSMGSASPAYFGNAQTNPTASTKPTWDSSKNFVAITAGQFLTFPLPSFSSTASPVSDSFSFSAWVKILTSIPAATTTIFSMYTSTGQFYGYRLQVTQSTKKVSLSFRTSTGAYLTFETGAGTPPEIALDTWQLIGFTASATLDKAAVSGTVFVGTSSYNFKRDASTYLCDFSSASVIRIGDSTSSFNGHISVVRITSPGGGIVRTTDLCSSDNGMELGVGNFALACPIGDILNPTDNTCSSSCPSGSYKATDSAIPHCVECSDHCTSCDATECLVCDADYFRYDKGCVKPCPDKTYIDGDSCQSCSDATCKTCDETKCLTCETGDFLYSESCVDSCPSKTWSTATTCTDCSKNCQVCDSSKCITCDSGFLLHQDGCVSSCPDKFYSDGQACQSNQSLCLDFSNLLQGCSLANCKTCPSDTCSVCETSYALYKGECVSCPDGTYSTGSTCKDCSANCKTCDATKCSVCNLSYLLYQGGCVGSCPAKSYSDGTSCIACSSHCAECDAAGCKVCDDGYELESEKTCASPPPPPVSREEAGSSGGGISGGIIAAIVGGSLVIFSSAAYSIYKFAAKRRRSDTHPYDQNKNSPGLEVSNPVSPTHTEVSNLVP